MRIHGTTYRRPLEMFESEEKPHLLPLPKDPWEHVEWRKAKVAPDCRISVDKATYSIPYRYIGKTLDVRLTKDTVQCYLNEELIKTHLRVGEGQHQIDPNDFPEDKMAFFMKTPQWCLQQATILGPSVRKVVEELLSVKPMYRLRRVQGIISLGERYGATRLNAACERALEFGDPDYHTIKTILAKGWDTKRLEDLPKSRADVSAYLHGQQQFAFAFDHHEKSTKEEVSQHEGA